MFFFGFHMLSQLVFLIGISAGIVWLARFAKRETVEKVAVGAILVGLIGALIAASNLGFARGGGMMNWGDDDTRNSMQERMEEMWDGNAQ